MPLFFAAASAGLIGSPYAAPLAVGHGLAYPSLAYGHSYGSPYGHSPLISSPLITKSIAAPVISAPIVKQYSPLAYSSPVVKTVLPAATSYSNTYKVSYTIIQFLIYVDQDLTNIINCICRSGSYIYQINWFLSIEWTTESKSCKNWYIFFFFCKYWFCFLLCGKQISQSVPVVHHAVASPYVSHAVASPYVGHAVASPYVSHAVASPLYGHGIASPLVGHAVASPVLSHAVASPYALGAVYH